jgi:DNA repair photolyase
VITKSDLVLRDLDLLEMICEKTYATVTFTITTAEDVLSRTLEPGAPTSSKRFAALRTLGVRGIPAGIALMPILPFIEDNEENIRQIVDLAAGNGAKYILPAFGMTLRDRQRDYYYARLDKHFPGLRLRYEKSFGARYSAPAQNAARLEELFRDLCTGYGMATKVAVFTPRKRAEEENKQPRLF